MVTAKVAIRPGYRCNAGPRPGRAASCRRYHRPGMSAGEPFTVEAADLSLGFGIVTVRGEVDLASAPDFGRRLTAALRASGPSTAVIDLGGVTYLDSSGIHALLGACRSLEADGGAAVLAVASAHLLR